MTATRWPYFWGSLGVLAIILYRSGAATGESMKQPLVRIAELEIDPAYVEPYTAALKEEIAASIRLEPGVLTLYAVAVKGHPAQARIFETYADQSAYEAHLQIPHFKKYKNETQTMVKSLNSRRPPLFCLARKPAAELQLPPQW